MTFQEWKFSADYFLTLSVPVSYQQPTSPYITHAKYEIWWWENENWSNKANYWRLKLKFSQICSMKSMGSGWKNTTGTERVNFLTKI